MKRLSVGRLRLWSCLGSGSLHACVVVGILATRTWLALDLLADPTRDPAALAQVSSQRIVLEGGFLPVRSADGADRMTPVAVELVESADQPESPAAGAPDSPGVEASPDALAARIRNAIADAQDLSFDEQLAELRRRATELNDVSTVESVDRMTRTINGFLGVKPRADRPADEQAEGSFDFNTAQLHDVRRETLESGEVRYLTVLVDSQGRRFETEVDAATGQQLQKVFDLIRGNPLLEKVYRRVVMGLLDQLIQPVGGAAAGPNP